MESFTFLVFDEYNFKLTNVYLLIIFDIILLTPVKTKKVGK